MSHPTPELYKALFEDDKRGAAILDHLIQVFARDAVVEGGIDAVLKTYKHAGQRKVLDFIASQINRANGVQTQEEE
jgi:hypothetical protein